jgi:microcystin-dependent protein
MPLSRSDIFRGNGTDALVTCVSVPLPFARLALALVDSYHWQSILSDDSEIALMDGGIGSLVEAMATSSEDCSMIGMIVAFPAPANLPPNVLQCNGTTYDKDMWPKLYDFLGSTTLPDMSNRFLLGSGLRNPGVNGGEDSHALTVNELPEHTHVYTLANGVDVAEGKGGVGVELGMGVSGTAGTNQAHNNMPPYIVVKYGIVAA